MPSRAARRLVVALAALAGGVIGYALAPPRPSEPRTLVLPYPHHVPKTPGGVSLRFAMIQDVLHERFAHHGRAYYIERNRLARDELAKLEVGERYFALMDDLGAGLD